MGIDITSYRGLKKVEVHFDKDGDPINPVTGELLEGVFQPYRNPDFPGRCSDLGDRAAYTYTEGDGRIGMGYGRYNAWREELAKLAGYPLTEFKSCDWPTEMKHSAACWLGQEGPFCELINFSDCEGTIGTAVSAKLAKDFQEWDEKAKGVGGWFYERYTEFRDAFERASDGGAVDFH